MTASAELSDGTHADLESFDGRLLVLRAQVARAPGTPVELRVPWAAPGSGFLEGRTVGCRRLPDGRYEIRLRMVNLRREARDALSEAVGSPPKEP